MRLFEVQGIEIRALRDELFDFVRDPATCPNGRTRSSRRTMIVRVSKRPRAQWRLSCAPTLTRVQALWTGASSSPTRASPLRSRA
jgi:hypothetical protein